MNYSNFEDVTLPKKLPTQYPCASDNHVFAWLILQVMSFNSCKKWQCHESNLGTIFWIKKWRIRDRVVRIIWKEWFSCVPCFPLCVIGNEWYGISLSSYTKLRKILLKKNALYHTCTYIHEMPLLVFFNSPFGFISYVAWFSLKIKWILIYTHKITNKKMW